MSYRFVHTADIHLDSPLRTLALRNPELSQIIGLATRQAFVRTVDLCLEEQVDALVLAGDLYDREQTSMKTAKFLAEQLARLHAAAIRTFIIRGNHDALSKITAELVMPDSVKVFGGAAEAISVDRSPGHFPVAMHGLSFVKSHAPESLLKHYLGPVPDAVNVGLMHTSLGGSETHDLYAPCSVADLQQSGFQYWALGHIHRRSVVSHPTSTIVMPGMPQGRDVNEDGPKSVSLVTIRDDRSVVVEERRTCVAQFERVAVDVAGVDDWRSLVDKMSSALEHARGSVEADHLVARIELTGASALAWRMRRDADLLTAEMETRGSIAGKTWIDKVHVRSTDADTSASSSVGALEELSTIITQQVQTSSGYRTELRDIADEIRGQLPPELRDIFGTDPEAFESVLANVGQQGASSVLARLRPRDAD